VILFILTIFALIALVDMRGLLKKKYRKELIVFSSIFIIALSLSLLLSFGVALYSPIKVSQYFLKDILHLSYK